MWWGRGYRWRFWATGIPGWAVGAAWVPWCWRFPWLPRGWWSGIYGPVEWTAQGPQLKAEDELAVLKQIRDEIKAELSDIEKRISELQKVKERKR